MRKKARPKDGRTKLRESAMSNPTKKICHRSYRKGGQTKEDLGISEKERTKERTLGA